MSKMNDIQVVIEEVARIALENERRMSLIAHELGLDIQELEQVRDYLNSLLINDQPKTN
jgi:hypothetical protein